MTCPSMVEKARSLRTSSSRLDVKTTFFPHQRKTPNALTNVHSRLPSNASLWQVAQSKHYRWRMNGWTLTNCLFTYWSTQKQSIRIRLLPPPQIDGMFWPLFMSLLSQDRNSPSVRSIDSVDAYIWLVFRSCTTVFLARKTAVSRKWRSFLLAFFARVHISLVVTVAHLLWEKASMQTNSGVFFVAT